MYVLKQGVFFEGVIFKFAETLITDQSIQYCNGAEGRLRHSTYAKSLNHENMPKYIGLIERVCNSYADVINDYTDVFSVCQWYWHCRNVFNSSFISFCKNCCIVF